MPFKSEKIPLGSYDRRIKLTDVQRDEIKQFCKQGLSYRAIAKLKKVVLWKKKTKYLHSLMVLK